MTLTGKETAEELRAKLADLLQRYLKRGKEMDEMLGQAETREVEYLAVLNHLRNSLPSTIRNTPHSCQTESHCCALHAAHNSAAEKVEKILSNEIERWGK